jgi:hypothetical protein
MESRHIAGSKLRARTSGGESSVPTEFWIVLFFDWLPCSQFKCYTTIGGLLAGQKDNFGFSEERKLDHQVYHVSLEAGTSKPVGGPEWR